MGALRDRVKQDGIVVSRTLVGSEWKVRIKLDGYSAAAKFQTVRAAWGLTAVPGTTKRIGGVTVLVETADTTMVVFGELIHSTTIVDSAQGDLFFEFTDNQTTVGQYLTGYTFMDGLGTDVSTVSQVVTLSVVPSAMYATRMAVSSSGPEQPDLLRSTERPVATEDTGLSGTGGTFAIGGTAWGDYSIAIGGDARKVSSMAFGPGAFANRRYSVAIGQDAYVNNHNAIAFGIGNLILNPIGAYQASLWQSNETALFQDFTANATPKVIGQYDWSDYSLLIPNSNRIFCDEGITRVRGTVMAKNVATSDVKVWNVDLVLKQDSAGSGATSIGGAGITVLGNDAGAAAWALTWEVVAAATFNIQFKGTGAAATDILWMCTLDIDYLCANIT